MSTKPYLQWLLAIQALFWLSAGFASEEETDTTVGVSLPDADSFKALEATLKEVGTDNGLGFVFRYAGDNKETELEQVNDLLSLGIGALILIPVGDVPSSDSVRAARDRNIPVVNIEKNTGSPPDSYIYTDMRGAGIQLGKWVCENQIEFSNVLLPQYQRDQSGLTYTSGFMHEVEICANGKAKFKDLILTSGLQTEATEEILENLGSETRFQIILGHSSFTTAASVQSIGKSQAEAMVVGHSNGYDAMSLIENESTMAVSVRPNPEIAQAAVDTLKALLMDVTVLREQSIPAAIIDASKE